MNTKRSNRDHETATIDLEADRSDRGCTRPGEEESKEPMRIAPSEGRTRRGEDRPKPWLDKEGREGKKRRRRCGRGLYSMLPPNQFLSL